MILNCPVFSDIVLIVATLPLLDPLIRCPAINSKAPGESSTTLINSLVDSVIVNSTDENSSLMNADIFSPTLNLDIACVTLNDG